MGEIGGKVEDVAGWFHSSCGFILRTVHSQTSFIKHLSPKAQDDFKSVFCVLLLMQLFYCGAADQDNTLESGLLFTSN